MPYRIEFDGVRRLIVKAEGGCDLADTLAMLQNLAEHRQAGTADRALLDLRQSDYTPTFDDVQALAEAAGRVVRLPLALVVAGALHTGVAHQFATFADALDIRVGVFADPDAAADWLRTDEQLRPGC
jgi:hypothetical protein